MFIVSIGFAAKSGRNSIIGNQSALNQLCKCTYCNTKDCSLNFCIGVKKKNDQQNLVKNHESNFVIHTLPFSFHPLLNRRESNNSIGDWPCSVCILRFAFPSFAILHFTHWLFPFEGWQGSNKLSGDELQPTASLSSEHAIPIFSSLKNPANCNNLLSSGSI